MLAAPIGATVMQVALVTGTLLIVGALQFSHQPAGAFAFFFLWAVLFAAYFLSRGQASVQLGAIGLAYGLLLGFGHGRGPSPVGAWLLTIGSLAVAGALVRTLSERVASLMAMLSRAAETDELTGLLNRRGFSGHLTEERGRFGGGGAGDTRALRLGASSKPPDSRHQPTRRDLSLRAGG